MRIGYDRDNTVEYGKKFGMIILAAGLSSRMKDFKPLLHVDGRPAIEGLIEVAKAAGLEDITVVTGHGREKLIPVIARHEVSEAYNENHIDGMFSSIKKGLLCASEKKLMLCASEKKDLISASENKSLNSASTSKEDGSNDAKKGFFIIPVDCPLISVSIMRLMMAETNKAPDAFAVATFEGKKGHPLYIPASFVEEICHFDGQGGLAAITDRYDINRIETGEEGCILDMDTPEGYADIKTFVEKGFAREKLDLLTARKRIFLVRHGETQQHDEPMFIGQHDVPLNEEGRRQAMEAGRQIAELMREDVEAEALGMDKFGKEPLPAIERIYSSDLSRAKATADIIKEQVNGILPEPVEVKTIEGLREISLGPWEGRPVSEIKKNCAEDFERRGRDMMAFKIRGSEKVKCGENFYDLQYRAVAALREILRNDDAKDIIIVTHSAVIRALENKINGGRVEDEWEAIGKGEFRMLEPFPLQPSEKVHGDKPMNMNDLTMDAVLEYYE